MVYGAWRNWELGDEVVYEWHDFDGSGRTTGTVIEKHDDHLIVEADGMKLWCDDCTGDMFSHVTRLTLGPRMVEIDILKGGRP